MVKKRTAVARYLPVEPVQKIWGVHVLDGGYTIIPPDSSYPPGHHPKEYVFTWDTGRVLSEYQLVYISNGRGVFESQSGGKHDISAGTVFLLFPGEWHRYKPDVKKGWHENWIGFNGTYAQKIMSKLFSKEEPVLHVGFDNELLHIIRTISNAMTTASLGYREMISGYTIAALSKIRKYVLGGSSRGTLHEERMEKARVYISEHSAEEIDLRYLAGYLGMSYSGFRSTFKNETGLSPRQFQLWVRINQAKELLANTNQSLSEIAERLGFASLYYFSRIFSSKIGYPPSEFRKKSRKHR